MSCGAPAARTPRVPRSLVSDDVLLEMIRAVIREAPFAGEGHREVTSRLRREREGPRGPEAGVAPHAPGGTIIPAAPDRLWGTDATMAYTSGRRVGLVAVDHCDTVAKRGDRFAATEPIYDAVRERFGEIAPGIALRHDWGP